MLRTPQHARQACCGSSPAGGGAGGPSEGHRRLHTRKALTRHNAVRRLPNPVKVIYKGASNWFSPPSGEGYTHSVSIACAASATQVVANRTWPPSAVATNHSVFRPERHASATTLDQLLQPHQTVLRPHLQTQTQPRGEGVPTQLAA